jgi:hypothetical protein
MSELELGEDGRTAEDAPCICRHAPGPAEGTYDDCDRRCGKCYWSYQDWLSGPGDW